MLRRRALIASNSVLNQSLICLLGLVVLLRRRILAALTVVPGKPLEQQKWEEQQERPVVARHI